MPTMTHAALRNIFSPDRETQGGFAVVIAPRPALVAAATGCLRIHGDRLLYVSGNYPPVLTSLDRGGRTFRVRRALTAYQLLSILDEAWAEETIIIEHDRGLFDDAPETATAIGMACADRAQAATVILIARRPDEHLRQMMPRASAIVHLPQGEEKSGAPGRGTGRSARQTTTQRRQNHAPMDL